MNDSKGFWNIIEKMNNWGKKKKDETEQIKPSIWKEYFTKLLNKPSESKDSPSYTSDHLPTFHPILDRIITMDEMRKA